MSLFSALHTSPLLWTAIVFVFSLAIGSFLNVVIHRLPKMLERQWRAECADLTGAAANAPAAEGASYNLVVPRSACPACGHRITALENIPVVSWLVLRGKCSACAARISARYPVVELATALLSAYVAWHFGFTMQAFAALLFVWALIALACIDLDTFYLPDDITLPLVWAGLLVNLFGVFTDLPSAVLGAAGGYLVLWTVYWLFKWATGKEGMGYGDFKLLAAIGAWLGWQALPTVILLSSFVGAVIGITLLAVSRRGRNTPLPFGPYLVAAALIALFWGDAITRYYLDKL
jgi:leader peptidase (prepilin peptidase)/N-methyltransferase